MIKKLTKIWLKKNHACIESYDYVCENGYIGLDPISALEKAMDEDRFSDANWFIVRIMNKCQGVQYAIFAAEQVLVVYEKEYPKDDRPKKAIEAAKKYLKNPSLKTRTDAANAAYEAYEAAYAAYAAYAANASNASYAANAAYEAANAAYAAYASNASNASYAANAAYEAANAADNLKKEIIKNGIEILKKESSIDSRK